MDILIAPEIATGREEILCWMPSAEPHSRTLDAVAQPLDLAALPVCGPACGGRAAKAESTAEAGPAAPRGAALDLRTAQFGSGHALNRAR